MTILDQIFEVLFCTTDTTWHEGPSGEKPERTSLCAIKIRQKEWAEKFLWELFLVDWVSGESTTQEQHTNKRFAWWFQPSRFKQNIKYFPSSRSCWPNEPIVLPYPLILLTKRADWQLFSVLGIDWSWSFWSIYGHRWMTYDWCVTSLDRSNWHAVLMIRRLRGSIEFAI